MNIIHNSYAIFPGSFDPIHNGHIQMAEYACHQYGWERIYLIPTSHFLNRRTPIVLSGEWRLKLCRAALEERNALPGTLPSSLRLLEHEITTHAPGYLIDTVRRAIRQQAQGHEGTGTAGTRVQVLLGSDLLSEIGGWEQVDELARWVHLYVCGRGGGTNNDTSNDTNNDTNGDANNDTRRAGMSKADAASLTAHGFQYTVCANPRNPTSSTEVRRRVAANESIRDMVPAAVERLIANHRLYQAKA